MKLSALPQQIVLSAIVSALLVLLALFMTANVVRLGFERELDQLSLEGEEALKCEAAPAQWRGSMGDFFQAYAYGPDGISLNPQAPPLEKELLKDVLEGGYGRTWVGEHRISVVKVKESGPCAILRIKRLPPARPTSVILTAFAIAAALAILMIGLGISQFTVKPILRRIEAIRRGAARVGDDSFTPSADPIGDALSEIAHTIEVSHGRILSDREELERRHRALEVHMAEIAHDLRTPLASLQLAVEDLADEPEPEHRELAHRALHDVVYLSSLVENLHQGARLRHGLVVPEGEVDLTELCERLGIRFEALGRRDGTSVAVSVPDGPVVATCDPSLAERALANLLQNALTHGEPGGHIALLLSKEGSTFSLRILDDGPGIPPEVLVDLSSPTFATTLHRARGPGLGLGIAKEIARRAVWTLDIMPLKTQGTEIRITGPC